MAPLLDIRDLQIRFRAIEAVRGLILNLDEGEVPGLVGESNSGKSATALAILGLLGNSAQVTGQNLWQSSSGASAEASHYASPSSLWIDLLLQPAGELRRLRGRRVAMIFQEPMTALNPVLSISLQVAEGASAHSRSPNRSEGL